MLSIGLEVPIIDTAAVFAIIVTAAVFAILLAVLIITIFIIKRRKKAKENIYDLVGNRSIHYALAEHGSDRTDQQHYERINDDSVDHCDEQFQTDANASGPVGDQHKYEIMDKALKFFDLFRRSHICDHPWCFP